MAAGVKLGKGPYPPYEGWAPWIHGKWALSTSCHHGEGPYGCRNKGPYGCRGKEPYTPPREKPYSYRGTERYLPHKEGPFGYKDEGPVAAGVKGPS